MKRRTIKQTVNLENALALGAQIPSTIKISSSTKVTVSKGFTNASGANNLSKKAILNLMSVLRSNKYANYVKSTSK